VNARKYPSYNRCHARNAAIVVLLAQAPEQQWRERSREVSASQCRGEPVPRRTARNANNVAISGSRFLVNFLFVPGLRRYSDANPEQITALGSCSLIRLVFP
jgi:hypothetical protein